MKQIFNFYLDDVDKQRLNDRFEHFFGEKEKGQIAAFLRVSIKRFINTPDERVDQDLLNDVLNEYAYSKIKNKRSKL